MSRIFYTQRNCFERNVWMFKVKEIFHIFTSTDLFLRYKYTDLRYKLTELILKIAGTYIFVHRSNERLSYFLINFLNITTRLKVEYKINA